jgi:SAM-dependent methyltransferase
MDTIEIKDDEINVEDIMRQIRENIRKRKESGVYTEEMEALINEPLKIPAASEGQNDQEYNLNYINSNWDVHADYNIGSHRPILGRFLIYGRQLIHSEVRRYVDIIIGKQIEFNAHVVRVLNNFTKDFDSRFNEHVATVNRRIDDKANGAMVAVNRSIDNKVNGAIVTVNRDLNIKVTEATIAVNNDINIKVEEAKATINWEIDNKINESLDDFYKKIDTKVNETTESVNWEIDSKLNEAVTGFYKNIDSKINEATAVANKPLSGQIDRGINYFLFEEKFRGSTEEIKQRQSIFLDYFKNSQNVLDIGCGRGEFLSLLKENGIGARGIDINEDMVAYCKNNGLEVQKVEALFYLESLDNTSLDGVFTGQLVEHLQPGELINLVKLCYNKMKYGAHFIIETVNPLCLSVFAASFYMDLSHVKPVHPETIKFLLESAGFKEIKFEFFSPFPESARLSKLTISDGMNDEEKARLEAMNQNIDKLNSLLYGYQDYAVIAKK